MYYTHVYIYIICTYCLFMKYIVTSILFNYTYIIIYLFYLPLGLSNNAFIIDEKQICKWILRARLDPSKFGFFGKGSKPN